MSKTINKEYVKQLVNEIKKHDHAYYVKNQPIISDGQYDQLYKELLAIEKQHPDWVQPDWPTQRVTESLTKEFPTYTHLFALYSLDNTYNQGELKDFIARVEKNTGHQNLEFVAELKYDGAAVNLYYKNGKLIKAATRGNGKQGDEITNNIKTINSIPLQLFGNDYPDELEVRGEVFMPFSVFEQLNQDLEKDNKKPFANPRNAAAGSLKLQNPQTVAQRKLNCYFYAVQSNQNTQFKKHSEWLNALRRWGFLVPDYEKICTNFNDIINYIETWNVKKTELPLPTDGVVIKLNNIALQEEIGFTAKAPRWAIAYKFEAEQKTTQLLSVDYQVGRTGAITPVANLSPVQLSGTTVKRATLHNADEIKRLNLHHGDTVLMEKSGEIIPKILNVITENRKNNATPIQFPHDCPACQTPLTKDADEAIYYCPNKTQCPPQRTGALVHWASKKAMDIQNVGEEIIMQFYELGLLKTPADFYTQLNKENLLGLKLTKNNKTRILHQKSVDRILTGISESKEKPFQNVLFALGIKHVGVTIAEKLTEKFNNIEKLTNATKQELEATDDLGEKIAESIINYFSYSENIELIKTLKQIGLHLEIQQQTETQNNHSLKLEGKSFIVSGTFNKDRKEIEEIIKRNGGVLKSSVSKNLDFLVAGDNMGPSKKNKADKLEIPIIGLDDLMKMIS